MMSRYVLVLTLKLEPTSNIPPISAITSERVKVHLLTLFQCYVDEHFPTLLIDFYNSSGSLFEFTILEEDLPYIELQVTTHHYQVFYCLMFSRFYTFAFCATPIRPCMELIAQHGKKEYQKKRVRFLLSQRSCMLQAIVPELSDF